MEANCAQYDLTWASWHTWCAHKTLVIFGWGAVWPSLGPRTRSNDSQDQLVVTMLFKNLHPRPVCGHHSGKKHANLGFSSIFEKGRKLRFLIAEILLRSAAPQNS